MDSNHRYPAKFFWLPRPCRAGDVAPPAATPHPDPLPASGEREYSVVLIRPDRRDCRARNSVKPRMAAPTATRQRPDRALVYAAIVIVAGVLATTLAQTQVLARLPLQNLLKNELHVDRTANAAFFFWAGLAWYLKPFAGILTDAFPLFGSRRKSYILVSATLAALSWLVLIVTPHEYRKLLFVVIVINTFMMVTSTVVGGYMVETAQANSGSGRLTALRQFVQQACWIVNGPAAGYLASIAFGWTAAACGGVMFMLVPVTILFLREQRQRSDPRHFLEMPAASSSKSPPPGRCGEPRA
jgi:hypothetical protein